MIGVYDYTVIATYLATVFGVCGLFQSFQGNILGAIVCLLFCGLLDTVDGRIARTKKNRTESEKRFGIQIDSLNDIVCFGVLPVGIGYGLYYSWLDAVPIWVIATLAFFLLSGLIRLAYFNTTEEERGTELGTNRTYYLGLPITSSTIGIPFFYLLSLLLPSIQIIIWTFGLLIQAVLFITPIHVKKPHIKGIILFIVIALLILSGLILVYLGVIN